MRTAETLYINLFLLVCSNSLWILEMSILLVTSPTCLSIKPFGRCKLLRLGIRLLPLPDCLYQIPPVEANGTTAMLTVKTIGLSTSACQQQKWYQHRSRPRASRHHTTYTSRLQHCKDFAHTLQSFSSTLLPTKYSMHTTTAHAYLSHSLLPTKTERQLTD